MVIEIGHIIVIHFTGAMSVALAYLLIQIIKQWHVTEDEEDSEEKEEDLKVNLGDFTLEPGEQQEEIGRASCRERV